MNSCENCGEEFASKLGLELHFAEYHGNRTGDKQNTGGEATKKTKEVKRKKKPAYRSFAGLKNIFVNNNMCKSISLWPQKLNPAKMTTVNSEVAKELDSGASELEMQEKVGEDAAAKGGATENNADNQNDLGLIEDSATVNSEFTADLASFISDTLSTSLLDMDTNETSFDLVEELDSDTSELNVDDVVMSGLPRPSSSSPFSAPAVKAAVVRPIRKSFVTPYKPKKKCDCEKCLMPKCGACYNCLNKRKTRLVYFTYLNNHGCPPPHTEIYTGIHNTQGVGTNIFK